jgi:hypothetical protein
MIGKFVLNTVVIGILLSAGAAQATTLKGVCQISASVHGGKKFATLKCYKDTDPGDFKIRSTVWEKDDKKAYNDMARFAGRRFACDMTNTGTTRNSNIETTHYHLEKCH